MQKSLLLLLCLYAFAVQANNLVITNVSLLNDSTLSFNLSWENSWRVSVAPNNHDAVWVFIKKRECASSIWSHVDLSAQSGAHSAGSPLEVYLDGRDATGVKGAFVRRSANGLGNINNVTVTLRMTGLVPGQYDFKVFGIEMVQVPQGAYWLGDGSSTYSYRLGSTPSDPFFVGSEDAITAGTGAGNLYAIGTTSATYVPASLPAAFPKGFREIYCMKYEISQGQYVDFVNHLAADQGAARQVTGTANRLNITGTWPALVANAPHRAMSFLAWNDLCAFLDWCALRPMTELEYEKISRGPVVPVSGEFVWGTNLIADANTLSADGTTNETATDAIAAGAGIANHNNNTVLGPMRVGFAAKTATNRQQAGATYYGVMEMSGNVYERCVSTRGTGFTGVLGDGELTTTPAPSLSNVPNWPVQTVANGTGEGLRGGAWNVAASYLRISDRLLTESNTGCASTSGGRGVR